MTCPPLPVFRGQVALESHAAGRHDLAPAAHASIIDHERHALATWRRQRRSI